MINARKIVKNGLNELRVFLTILNALKRLIPNKLNVNCIIIHTQNIILLKWIINYTTFYLYFIFQIKEFTLTSRNHM